MAKVYYPTHYIDVPASPPHEGNPAYRVSKGIEHWGPGNPQHVYKVQMVYNGEVSGRRSPSYPEGSNDAERVAQALADIKAGKGLSARGMILPV